MNKQQIRLLGKVEKLVKDRMAEERGLEISVSVYDKYGNVGIHLNICKVVEEERGRILSTERGVVPNLKDPNHLSKWGRDLLDYVKEWAQRAVEELDDEYTFEISVSYTTGAIADQMGEPPLETRISDALQTLATLYLEQLRTDTRYADDAEELRTDPESFLQNSLGDHVADVLEVDKQIFNRIKQLVRKGK